MHCGSRQACSELCSEPRRQNRDRPVSLLVVGRSKKGAPLLNDAKVRRWAGTFGVAGFVVFVAALPLYYLAGPEPRIEDTTATSAFVTGASTFILTRATLADPLIMSGFLVFLAGFR